MPSNQQIIDFLQTNGALALGRSPWPYWEEANEDRQAIDWSTLFPSREPRREERDGPNEWDIFEPGWDLELGSEFLKEFGPTVEELQLVHYFNRPNYPQGNGRIERSFRTDEEEFYQVEELPADLGGLEAALLAWNQVYERVRPHQALDYKTPEQFVTVWQTQRRKEAMCH